MLNLRDPDVNEYPTETRDISGSPLPTEPASLTIVVMNHVSTFQAGV